MPLFVQEENGLLVIEASGRKMNGYGISWGVQVREPIEGGGYWLRAVFGYTNGYESERKAAIRDARWFALARGKNERLA